jgi:hypothetical protein
MLIGGYEVPFIDDPYRPRDKMKLNFTKIIYERKTFGINAVGLDVKNMSDFVASDVNNHYFTRWGGLIGSYMLKGLKTAVTAGQDVDQAASENVSTTTIKPITETSEQLKLAFGEVGDILSEKSREQFDRPPTIVMDQGEMLALFFVDEIDNDELPALFTADELIKNNNGKY